MACLALSDFLELREQVQTRAWPIQAPSPAMLTPRRVGSAAEDPTAMQVLDNSSSSGQC
jgi:hypothetical protein